MTWSPNPISDPYPSSAGVYVLPTVEAAALLKEERAAAADFLIVGGVVSFGRAELAGMLARARVGLGSGLGLGLGFRLGL